MTLLLRPSCVDFSSEYFLLIVSMAVIHTADIASRRENISITPIAKGELSPPGFHKSPRSVNIHPEPLFTSSSNKSPKMDRILGERQKIRYRIGQAAKEWQNHCHIRAPPATSEKFPFPLMIRSSTSTRAVSVIQTSRKTRIWLFFMASEKALCHRHHP